MNLKNIQKLQSKRCVWLVMFVLFSFVQQTKAQIILTESFNYPPGSDWTGVKWTGTFSIVEGNLTYPGTIGNNIGNKMSLATGGIGGKAIPKSISTGSTGQSAYAAMVVNVSAADVAGGYFFALGTPPPLAKYDAQIYIKSSGSGFVFGIGKRGYEIKYESIERPFNTNIFLVLKYEGISGTNNNEVKLYVNPPLKSEPTTPALVTVGRPESDTNDAISLTYVHLFGFSSSKAKLELDGLNIGTNWESITSPLFDFGDAPDSYNLTKDGVYVPAAHLVSKGVHLGLKAPSKKLFPRSVAAGADNNGTNGDGLEEDVFDPAVRELRKGVPFVLDVPVSIATTTAYLYGWIDFNNNGRFEVGEAAQVSISTKGVSTQTLTWTGEQTDKIDAVADNLYMRLRLSENSITDYSPGVGSDILDERSIGFGSAGTNTANDRESPGNGEVEDYRIKVLRTFDFGDLPVSYEKDADGNLFPAKHAPLKGFSIGKLFDLETGPSSVAAGADNNGTNGDGEDEDGITVLKTVSRGAEYTLNVPLNVPSELKGVKYLYGWLDLNGNGLFEAGESATANISVNETGQINNKILTWTTDKTRTIANGTEKIYLRLRLSSLPLIDYNPPMGPGVVL